MALTFYEFFAGGGMARAGLGSAWKCLFANDIDLKKARSYVENWGADEFRLADIAGLKAQDLPGRADLAWASFPCQDLSLAGAGAGLKGARSGTFWEFHRLIFGLCAEGRAPRVLVLENVCGTLTSHEGKDFSQLCRALALLEYDFGALVMDAKDFLPQSRPRLFIVAVRRTASRVIPRCENPDAHWHSVAVQRAYHRLRPNVQQHWIWWRLSAPTPRTLTLTDIIDVDDPQAAWRSEGETARLIALMSDANRAKLEKAKRTRKRQIGTVYRRTRNDVDGNRVQRAEVRFDQIAGCLRTPAGGSSRQTIVVVEDGLVRSRLITAREAARLMGLPDEYILPTNYNDAYHLVGDGVAVPVVAHLARHLLAPMCRATALPAAAE